MVTDDPDNRHIPVPVTLVVPSYQQGVDAGGDLYTDANGDIYDRDRAYQTGSFGFAGGTSSIVTTLDPIAGTPDGALYQRQRAGMREYRFDLPNGHYMVKLRFAEVELSEALGRVFSVTLEGNPVLFHFDVFAAAGKDVAVDRTFEVDVTDGTLNVQFYRDQGKPPAVAGILVAEVPAGLTAQLR